jgi:excisionase family DNA binding protein
MSMNSSIIDPAVIYAMQEQLREIRSIISHREISPLPKSVMSLSEAADFTGFSKSHLYKLTSTRGIPCYKRGKHLQFKREELECWLLSNRRATVEEIDALASNYVTLKKGGVK